MATQQIARPPLSAVARSAAGVYVRKVAATVTALYALVGGVQLAGRTNSPLFVALTVTVLGVATAELCVPGLVTRGTLPQRTVQLAALVPLGAVWVALAVVIGSAGGQAVMDALGSLRVLVMFMAVFMGIFVVRGLATRDPEIIPAYRSDR